MFKNKMMNFISILQVMLFRFFASYIASSDENARRAPLCHFKPKKTVESIYKEVLYIEIASSILNLCFDW